MRRLCIDESFLWSIAHTTDIQSKESLNRYYSGLHMTLGNFSIDSVNVSLP